MPVAPPTSGEHLVAGAPQVGHQHQRHQVAGVQAGRGRIEARRRPSAASPGPRPCSRRSSAGRGRARKALRRRPCVTVSTSIAPYLPRREQHAARSAVTSRAPWPATADALGRRRRQHRRAGRAGRRAHPRPRRARHRRARALSRSRSPAARRRARSTRTWSTGIDWTRTDVFFGDERAVPPDDPQSNYRMARETLLDPARVPPANVFRWRAEDPPISTRAARDYEAGPARGAAARPGSTWRCSGLGPDGHTASLFPGTTALAEEDRLAVAVDVPALGTRRLTLTYPALCGAREVLLPGDGTRQARRAGRRRPAGQHAARRADRPPAGSGDAYSATGRPQRQDINGSAHDRPGRRHRRHQRPARDLRRAGRRPARRDAALRADLSLGVVRVAGRHRRGVPGGGRRRRSAPRAKVATRLPRHRRPDREQHLPRHQPALGRRRARAVAAPRDRARHAGERLPRRRAGRHRRRRRRAGRAGRRPAASRTGRSPCWAPAPASARRSCSGRPPRTATRSSPRRAATSTWRARTPLEHGLVQFLTNKYGRVSCERVLSGHGPGRRVHVPLARSRPAGA